MINKQRVQRIRGIIYTFIVLIILVPLILIIALSVRMIGLLDNLSGYLEKDRPATSQSEPAPQEQSGYVLEPDNQALDPSEAPGPGDELAPTASAPETQNTAASGDSEKEESGKFGQNAYLPATYPELYFDTLPVHNQARKNTIYLTFDNTPSSQAGDILDVLSKNGVKATFFVWWNETMDGENSTFYKDLIDAGHSIGIHSSSNAVEFSQLYSSADFFLQDYSNIFDKIYAETGVKTRLYRLPGGSVNPLSTQRQNALSEIKKELDSRGFIQYDWNASAQDAVYPPLSKTQVLKNMKNSVGSDGRVVVLLHDGTGSTSTVDALEDFITEYKDAGYTFDTLDYDTQPVSFLDK